MAKESLVTPEMLARFYARRDPVTNLFKKPGKVQVAKAATHVPRHLTMRSGNHKVTRVRHDIREYLESTREAV